MNYDGLSDEALEAIIADARNALAERRRGVSPRTVQSFLDLDSPNFMGLGMSLRELTTTGQIERNLRAYTQQVPTERDRRLGYVIELSAEFTAILKITRFSGGLAKQAIADVIEGDWHSVKSWMDYFAFGDEQGELRASMAPVFARFREILTRAYETVPKPEAAASSPS
jgi:hypothetical protein